MKALICQPAESTGVFTVVLMRWLQKLCACVCVCVTTSKSTIHSSSVRGFRELISDQRTGSQWGLLILTHYSWRGGDEKEGRMEGEREGGQWKKKANFERHAETDGQLMCAKKST